MKRRTDAEIAAVEKLHRETGSVAHGISQRVNGDDEKNWVHVNARQIYSLKAEYQREVATNIVVSFDTPDHALAERVALAIKAELQKET